MQRIRLRVSEKWYLNRYPRPNRMFGKELAEIDELGTGKSKKEAVKLLVETFENSNTLPYTLRSLQD